ncbi:unnamed protein product [Spirodela intermedia]|uniref:Uncharacterized protein n=1 Tax=Spirodela intermedia TaxID=51605 RepID=A0ABN7EDC7_SPIIN|nr:unnamed protein product [Spirodela intermedia]
MMSNRLTLVRSLWQAYWLDSNWNSGSDCLLGKLEESLVELEADFDDFLMKMKRSGWDDDAINIKVPKGPQLEEASETLDSGWRS